MTEASPPHSRRRLALHWQIVIGLIAGALFGGTVNAAGWSEIASTTTTYVRPIGTLFIRLITMIAAPLVLTSLVVGASSISDPKKLGRIGVRTIVLYLLTTAAAISIGLVLARLIRPGSGLSESASARLLASYGEQAGARVEGAADVSFIDALLNLVPTNPFEALAGGNMLQIVFFALIVGVALSLIAAEKAQPVVRFFDGFTDVLIKIVDIVMRMAPYGVFALIAGVTADFGFGILSTLSWYALTVLAGLAFHLFVVYGGMLRLLVGVKMPLRRFYREMGSVQLLGFSSSSSAATLPLNMETVREKLGVSERVTSFVLPLGATMNMDGTALYQGVAAVFIAQVYGLPLTMMDQLTVVLTATMASIGTAAVPGAGLVMLVIVLNAIGVPVEGIALILGIDRLLDMCRTVVNVTGDAAVAIIVAASENELGTVSVAMPWAPDVQLGLSDSVAPSPEPEPEMVP
jgi:Na+/H+-dicarboxylate symporter